ncbi:unnamed protein product [Closterium sp. NIES-53]
MPAYLPVVRPVARDGALPLSAPRRPGGGRTLEQPPLVQPPLDPATLPLDPTVPTLQLHATPYLDPVLPVAARCCPCLCCSLLLSPPSPPPPPPPPSSSPCCACSRGTEGLGVAGMGVMGGMFPFPSSSFRSHCCSCRLGGGCGGVGEPGEWHWGGGCKTNQPPSL